MRVSAAAARRRRCECVCVVGADAASRECVRMRCALGSRLSYRRGCHKSLSRAALFQLHCAAVLNFGMGMRCAFRPGRPGVCVTNAVRPTRSSMSVRTILRLCQRMAGHRASGYSRGKRLP
jgi:hypothetical protein